MQTLAGNGFVGLGGDLAPAARTSLSQPMSVAIGADGIAYLGEQVDGRGLIRSLDQATGLLSVLLDPTLFPRVLLEPAGLAWSASKALWVADPSTGELWRLALDAPPLDGSDLKLFTQLQQPTDVAVVTVGGTDVAYVVEHGTTRVLRAESTGLLPLVGGGIQDPLQLLDFAGVMGSDLALSHPTGVAASERHLFLCDRGVPGGTAFVLALDRATNELLNVLKSPGLLENPISLAIDPAGTLYILEGGDGSTEVGATSQMLLAVLHPESPAAEAEVMAGQDSMRDETQAVGGASTQQVAISISQAAT